MIIDRDVEKPLLPFTNGPTPNQSRTSSPPYHHHHHPSPSTTHHYNAIAFSSWRGLLSGRRRFVLLALVGVWFLFLGAWYRPPSFMGERWHHMEGVRHGRIPWSQVWGWGPHPSSPSSDGTGSPQRPSLGSSSKPLTELGSEADNVYSIGETDPELYQKGLEHFIRHHFPSSDSNEDDPDSLINAMRSFFPSISNSNPDYSPIPKKLWQTAASQARYDVQAVSRESFVYHNEGINITFHDDQMADEWIRRRFKLDGASDESGREGIIAAWDKLAHPPVLRSDFWRYLVLATEGGIYADTDIECRHNLRDWGPDVSWDGHLPGDYKPPSLIVGIEADVGDRQDWHQWWPRPLQISQWTMASARGHPVLIDTLKRVVELALAPESAAAEGKRLKSVMERTGPGPFTDAVLAYLYNKWDKTWADLRQLKPDGWRARQVDKWDKKKSVWGDMKVLSITGFSPGVGHMGSEGPDHPAAMVFHLFAGSWRDQEGADA